MRIAMTSLVATGIAGLVAVATPATADDAVIEHRTKESMHVETAPEPVVRERVIERQAPAAAVQKSKETVVKKGDIDDDDKDVDVDVDVDDD